MTIEVLVDENLIGTMAVGQDGNFASIFELNSSEEIRVLVLRIKNRRASCLCRSKHCYSSVTDKRQGRRGRSAGFGRRCKFRQFCCGSFSRNVDLMARP